jgi:hypothetical protein
MNSSEQRTGRWYCYHPGCQHDYRTDGKTEQEAWDMMERVIARNCGEAAVAGMMMNVRTYQSATKERLNFDPRQFHPAYGWM